MYPDNERDRLNAASIYFAFYARQIGNGDDTPGAAAEHEWQDATEHDWQDATVAEWEP